MTTTHNDRLLKAARRCHGHALGDLVRSGKVDIDITDKAGCTAVHLCAKSADLTSLATLLEHGARTDCFDQSGLTALHHAAGKDYVETMALLVSHGADINIRSPITSLTPLQYSTKNRRHKASGFLLFCGAGYDINGLEDKEIIQDEFEDVRAGIKNRRIFLEGKTIRSQGTFHFKSLGLTMTTHADSDTEVIFFCRRSYIEHSDCHIQTGNSDAISDVFDYLLNATLESVDVTIRVYTEASKFDTVYVTDNMRNEYACKHIKSDRTGIYYRTRITLHPYEKAMNSFAVYMRTRTDTFITTGMNQTCQSTVEGQFKIKFPADCLPANVAVKMQVFPVADFINSRYADSMPIASASNICGVHTENRHRKPVRLQLPLPTDMRAGDDVALYHADPPTGGNDGCEFDRVESRIESSSRCATVQNHQLVNGVSIVTTVRGSTTSTDIKSRIKRFLSWLYTVVTSRQRYVVFYGLSKLTGETYNVLVGLSTEQNAESDIRTWRENNYVIQPTQKSQAILSKPKQIFAVTCSGINATVIGQTQLKLSMQLNRMSYQVFAVTSPGRGIGQIGAYKYHRAGRLNQTCNECDCVTQINVALRTDKSPETFQTFAEFPDSNALVWLAREIGNEWFLLGISLGFRSSFLEKIEQGNSAHGRVQTMLRSWRTDNSSKPDIGLTAMYQGLQMTGRGDIIAELNRRLYSVMMEKPGETTSKWARSLLAGLDDVDALGDGSSPDFQTLIVESKVASPFSEQFLLTLLKIVGANLEITQQLGLPDRTTKSIKGSCPEQPDTAMFKCLLHAQRQHGEMGERLIRDLLDALVHDKDNEAVEKVIAECNMWLSTEAKNEDEKRKRKRLNAILTKCHRRE